MNNNLMAEKIKNLRTTQNLTQKQLAEKLNISDKAISKWERGLSYPDISMLPRLARELGCTIEELIVEENDILSDQTEDIPLIEDAVKAEDVPIARDFQTEEDIRNDFEPVTPKSKKKYLRIILAVGIVALSISLFAAFVNNQLRPLSEPEQYPTGILNKPTTYPYVFVHGLNGWGNDGWESNGLFGESIPYWGATSCNLMDELTYKGYNCVAPSGGMSSSAWDRACELYAALTGTTVDYGEAHSKEFGHERFGENNSTALLPGWGKEDATGHIQKINLIGHSFGGASSRMLAELLANGDEREQSASGENCSPLFTGGKADWIFSITALTAPHNGTTLLEAIDGENLIGALLNGLDLIINNPLGKIATGALEALGINIQNILPGHSIDEIIELSKNKDNAYSDLTLRGAKEVNEKITTLNSVYYFSLPVDGTKDSGGNRVATDDMFLILRVPANIMGKYKENRYSDIPIDSSWLPNDGLVPTVSEYAPSNAPKADFSEDDISKGIWYVFPTIRGDHGTPIGLMEEKNEWLLPFYFEHLERIDELSRIDTANWFSKLIYKIYKAN